MGTGFFLGVKSGWGVTLTLQPLLVPLAMKSRAIFILFKPTHARFLKHLHI
jgi:hypothetical protein